MFNPDFFRDVYKVDGAYPQRSLLPHFSELTKKLNLGDSLINTNNEQWKKLRSASNPIMVRPQTVLSYLPTQNVVANEFLDFINKKFDQNSSILNFNSFDRPLRLLALECWLIFVIFLKKMNFDLLNHFLRCE
jgi:hypothetical protein